MGYAGKLKERELAISLREQGFSYSEIRQRVNVSKDTLSRWCRSVRLGVAQLERLRGRKLMGSEKGRLIGSEVMKQKRLDQIEERLNTGKKEVGRLNKRDRFLLGVALYLGEGYKSDKAFGFTNSDPKVINFMMKWIREFTDIPEERLFGQIWIHDNLDEIEARYFWSGLTGIPVHKFQKSYISKNKIESNKVRKNIHKHGIFSVRASYAIEQRRILGWIAGVLEAKKVNKRVLLKNVNIFPGGATVARFAVLWQP